MPERSWDTSVWVANNAKIKSALGWQPQYSFEQGFRRLVDWFERNPALQSFYQERLTRG
jgi:dTDP-D-glucose 4,6-dehydratase